MNDNEVFNPEDALGYIGSKPIDINDVKSRLQNIFSSNSIRVNSNVYSEIVSLLEELVDDSNHNNIKDFLAYLKEKFNFTFIREQTEEVVLFDEDVTEINE